LAIDHPEVISTIKAVLLVADPARMGSDPRQIGSADVNSKGIYATISTLVDSHYNPPIPPELSGITTTACDAEDVICALKYPSGLQEHEDYAGDDDAELTNIGSWGAGRAAAG
jgi:hypothetical protein